MTSIRFVNCGKILALDEQSCYLLVIVQNYALPNLFDRETCIFNFQDYFHSL